MKLVFDSFGEDVFGRFDASRNKNTPASVLMKLSADKHHWVRDKALNNSNLYTK